MPDIAAKLDYWSDRITDRLMRTMPGPRIKVGENAPLVSFTFDDVPDTALSNGAAILERHGVRGTFYISGGLAGRKEPGRTLISVEGCREIAARGHEIGCHTWSHAKIRRLGARAIDQDLEKNKLFLASLGCGEPVSFAYPYNAASFPARGLMARRFRTCRAGGERINRGPTNPAFLSGVEIRQPESHAVGLTAWIDRLLAKPGWLIFFTHDIASSPTPYGCTPETFQHLVGYAVKHGCQVLPVREALSRLQGKDRA